MGRRKIEIVKKENLIQLDLQQITSFIQEHQSQNNIYTIESHKSINSNVSNQLTDIVPDNIANTDTEEIIEDEIIEDEIIEKKKKRGRKSKQELLENMDNKQLYDNNQKIVMQINNNIAVKKKNNCLIPWNEKYRPYNIDDIEMNDTMRGKINNFIETGLLPNIIITGPSGTGKTSSIICIAKKILGSKWKEGLLELNASDNRGIDMINNSIKYHCSKMMITNDNTLIKKIIIFDEADNMTMKAQQLLSILMETYNDTTKFCFTCNDSTKIIETIQNKCVIMNFRTVSDENIKKRLIHICSKENIEYDEKGINAIIYMSQGDIRNAINNLESMYYSYDKITEQNVYKLCYQPHPTNIIEIIQNCVNKNFTKSINKYEELLTQGYCNSDILQLTLNILQQINIDETIRINFIKIISETYLLINEGINTNLQIYSAISKMILYILSKNKSE